MADVTRVGESREFAECSCLVDDGSDDVDSDAGLRGKLVWLHESSGAVPWSSAGSYPGPK